MSVSEYFARLMRMPLKWKLLFTSQVFVMTYVFKTRYEYIQSSTAATIKLRADTKAKEIEVERIRLTGAAASTSASTNDSEVLSKIKKLEDEQEEQRLCDLRVKESKENMMEEQRKLREMQMLQQEMKRDRARGNRG